jgi:hypothetical protein
MPFPKCPYIDALISNWEKHPSFPTFYPRRIITPHGYQGTKGIAALLCANSICPNNPEERSDAQYKTLLAVTGELLRTDIQYFWLGKDIGDDLLVTTPPVDVMLGNLKFPFNAFVIMLPPDFIAGVYAVLVARGEKDSIFICFLMIGEDGVPGHGFVMPPSQVPVCELIQESVYDISIDAVVPMNANSTTISNKMILLLTNILCYLSSEGVEIEQSQQVGKPKTVGKAGLWTPRWIAPSYKRDRGGEGTHASPRTHWRRGHWRNQRFGEGRADVKRLWIRPMMIAVSPS